MARRLSLSVRVGGDVMRHLPAIARMTADTGSVCEAHAPTESWDVRMSLLFQAYRDLSITARDLRLPTAANDTISSNPSRSKPTRSAPRAASVAKPLPQCFAASRQPTSTQGENGNSGDGVCSPTKPMNSCEVLVSTAQKPQPRSAISAWQRSAIVSLSARERSAGKNSITFGSALSAAKGSRSAAHH